MKLSESEGAAPDGDALGAIPRTSGALTHVVYVAEVLTLSYLVSLPVACRLDNTRVPVVLRPLAHVLETPAYPVMECYLRAWGVDPDIVRCAMYEP